MFSSDKGNNHDAIRVSFPSLYTVPYTDGYWYKKASTNLSEPNILALLPETLATDIEPVFPNQTGLVCAYSTVGIDISPSDL